MRMNGDNSRTLATVTPVAERPVGPFVAADIAPGVCIVS